MVWERVDDGVRDEATGAVERSRKGSPRSSTEGKPGRPRAKAGSDLRRAKSGGGERKAGSGVLEPKERRGRERRAPGAGTGGADARDELVKALGATKGDKANARLRDAAHAFERERYEEARGLLRPIAEAAPQATSVRELLGLTYYRLGKWNEAIRELGAFREMTGSTEQNPVLADCNRALKRYVVVEELWDELREDSPAPDLVTEGRIVMAGSLADRGEMARAIALLEKSQRSIKRAQLHHLRQGYALADLYEQAGEVARAREMFRWIVDHEPGFANAAERASSLA